MQKVLDFLRGKNLWLTIGLVNIVGFLVELFVNGATLTAFMYNLSILIVLAVITILDKLE